MLEAVKAEFAKASEGKKYVPVFEENIV